MLVGFFLIGLAGVGFLPRSPLYYANRLLFGMSMYVPYLPYVSAFVPIETISYTLFTWVGAIIWFHYAKWMLRKGGFIG